MAMSHREKISRPRVVILGAGFGGIYTLLNLFRILGRRSADITIINRTNYFLFTPLLHEVATGGIAHHNVVESLRALIAKSGAKLHVASVEKINTAAKTVQTSAGVFPYDFLVTALGAKTNFYGIPGAEEHSLVLKDLYDAIKMRNAVIEACEMATNMPTCEARKKLLTFTVIGGGATGVELAAEMADLLFDTVRTFYRGVIEAREITIHLATAGDSLLPQFHPSLRARAERALVSKGVRVEYKKQAIRVEKNRVVYADGSSVESGTIVWVAGVMPEIVPADVSLPLDARGRIIVNEFLQVKGHETVFALGDIASREQSQGKAPPAALPMLAQVAVAEAAVVAANIAALIRLQPLRPFYYTSRGELVSVGSWHAVANIFGTRWSGALAWFIWRTVYLFKFPSWSKKIKVAFDWTIDMFYPRDITKA